MGIDTKIRNELLKGRLCPEAFQLLDKPLARPSGSRSVVIMDLLTDLHSAWNPRTKSRSFTGLDLVHWLLRLVVSNHLSKGFQAAIVCIDDSKRVPSMKRSEQKRRDDDRREEPLPDGTTFCHGGAVLVPGGPPREFDIGSALGNRSVRPALYTYLIEGFRQEFGKGFFLPFPGTEIVFDYFADGAIVYRDGAWGKDHRSKHAWGEADLAMVYWLNRLWPGEPANYYVRTTDSDLIPILLNFLLHRGRAFHPYRGLWLRYWYYSRTSKVGWMDMQRLYQYFRKSQENWSIFAFVFYCCLCGSDYTDPKQAASPRELPKRQLFHGISPVVVYDALERFEVYKKLDEVMGSHEPVVLAVRAVYTHVCTDATLRPGSARGMPKSMRARLATEHGMLCAEDEPFSLGRLAKLTSGQTADEIPSVAVIRKIWKQLVWNLKYWLIDWLAETAKQKQYNVPHSIEFTERYGAGGAAAAMPDMDDSDSGEAEAEAETSQESMPTPTPIPDPAEYSEAESEPEQESESEEEAEAIESMQIEQCEVVELTREGHVISKRTQKVTSMSEFLCTSSD